MTPTTESAATTQAIDRLRGLVGVLAVGFVLLLAQQLTPRPQLEAQRFVLRDSARVFRGALETREDGASVIRLNDGSGRPRLYGMVPREGRPRLRFTDDTGMHRMQLELDADDRPVMRLADVHGTPRLHLWIDDAGQPWVQWEDSTTQRRVGVAEPLLPPTREPARRASRAR